MNGIIVEYLLGWMKLLGFNMKRFFLIFLFINTVVFAQTWQIINNPMPMPVYGGQAVVKDSMIYILGGIGNTGHNVNLIQQYNPKSNTWQVVDTMKAARSNFIAGNYNHSIIYFGGVENSMQNSSSLEMWDGNSSPSIIVSNQIFNRLYSTGVVVGNNIFMFGGTMMGRGSSYMVEYNIPSASVVYNYNNDSLFSASFPIMQMSALLGDNIYIFGGVSGIDLLQKSIIKFDTAQKTFSSIQVNLDKPLAGGTAVPLSNNKIYIIGGFNETDRALSSVEVLNLNNDSSEEIEDGPELNNPRTDLMAVNYYGSIYVFGGKGENGQPVAAVEKLDVITGVPKNSPQIVSGFKLENNYPNPFNPSTQISFTIGKESHVSLDVYSILGEHIKNIVSKIYSPGEYRLTWDGTNNFGRQVAAGIYIYKLASDYFTDSKKMILLK
ncbi:MAG: Kelch repeat-containing protein [Ignavibacteriaceae bacterium]